MRAGMHKPVDDGITSYETSLTFAIGPNCLSADKSQDAHPVRIAGLDGVAIEPYEPSVTFGSPTEGDVTRAHAFAVADRTLCVFVTWQASTPEDEREAALAVLETILAEPIGDDRIRVRFMLDAGWDTG